LPPDNQQLKEIDRMGRLLTPTSIAAMSLVACGLPTFAQQTDQELREEIKVLQQGQEQIKKELAEIKQLLRTQPKSAPSGPNVKDKVFDLGDNLVKGEQTARLTLVEFTDYQ